MAWLKTNGLSCEMGNDRMSLAFSSEGKATSVVVDGRELLAHLSGADTDPDKKHSFYCDYHVNLKTHNLTPTRLVVVDQTPDLVHVAYVDDVSDLKLAYHLVIATQDIAVYGYVVAETECTDITINELRTVYRFDSNLFTTAYTAARQGLQPCAQDMAERGEWLQDETYRLSDGTRYSNSDVYSKYDYAGYFSENTMWGQWSGGRSDNEWGAWFIPLDKSCYPGGPLKQELLVHYDSIILNYMTGAHFGTGDFVVPKGWRKLYGPWCLYFNHGVDVVTDALNRAHTEQNDRPVAWMPESELYTTSYAQLTGTVMLKTPREHLRGWVLVASDKPGEYFDQKAGRVYYTTTQQYTQLSDANASKGNVVDTASEVESFTITHMQPGHYWLRGYLPGTTDATEYELGEIDITAGEHVDMGLCVADNIVRPLIWSIGTHTGTTKGFLFSDQPRNYVWVNLVPTNLTYHIGSNDTWYYLQRSEGAWNIVFDRPQIGQTYLLTVCLAGTTLGHMIPGAADVGCTLTLNGHELITRRFENDRAAYRSSVTGGKPACFDVIIDADAFVDHNTLTFTTDGYLMYDMIKLEAIGDDV